MTIQHLLYCCGGILALLVGLIRYLGLRMVKQFDDALLLREAADKKRDEADRARDAAEAESRKQIGQLTNALNLQVEESAGLRRSLASLLQSFSAWDKWIYGELQHGTFKTSPPRFDHSSGVPAPLAA